MINKKIKKLKKIVLDSLDNLKTHNVVYIDVRNKSNFTDALVIGTGTSSTHIKAISEQLIEKLKKNGHGDLIIGVELNSDWVLIDLSDIIVNLMLKETRDFYSLEKLWSIENSLLTKNNTI